MMLPPQSSGCSKLRFHDVGPYSSSGKAVLYSHNLFIVFSSIALALVTTSPERTCMRKLSGSTMVDIEHDHWLFGDAG